MKNHIFKLLSFRVYGRFAHFRKFYTNSSSLSYFIPPRTVIMGMLASVLKYPRDSYYELFKPDDVKLSVSVTPGTIIKKQIQSLNYLHATYHNLLVKGSGTLRGLHSQCKLELLLPRTEYISYEIYAGAVNKESVELLNNIETRIRDRDFGFGVYLGQRQFRADIDDIQSLDNIPFVEKSPYVDSICLQENAELDTMKNVDVHIIIDQMPIHMQQEEIQKKKTQSAGRMLHSVKRVVYEKSGKRIFGSFRNCYQVKEKIISFYEG